MRTNQRQRNRRNRRNSNRNRRRRRRLFIKTLCLTTAIFLVIIFAGWITLRNIIRPPSVVATSANGLDERSNHGDDGQDTASYTPDHDDEDDLVGAGYPIPKGFTLEDRKDEFYTFLIFGMDGGINTDTIMVAAYDGVLGKAYVIGLPRDTKVNVKRNTKKINAAYPVGTRNGGGMEGGVDQLKREMKTIIGFIPDYYVCIDFDAFINIVDAVNGVEIDVPFNMVYDDPDQDLHINIKQGLRTLDGKDALRFARYRKGNNSRDTITDYQRIENQQTVIKALLTKLFTPASLLKVPEFVTIFNENVHTDLKMDEILYFADQLRLKKITGLDALESYTMPTTGTSGPPSYYELLDEAAIVELINRTINPFIKDIEAKDLDIIS